MKYIVFLIAVFCNDCGYYQKPVMQFTKEEWLFKVVDTSLVSPVADLYDRVYVWVVFNYRSTNDVIQYADKNVGKIIAKNATNDGF